jgi:acetyltransferase-like isoleucine patch superfamily enzyme
VTRPRSVGDRLRDLRFDLVLTVANWLLRRPGHRLRLAVMRSLLQIDVDPSCAVERGVRATTRGGVTIGAGCNINRGVVLDGRGGLRIGSLVNISPGACLLTAGHDVDSPTFDGLTAATVVGDRCWVATGALVLPGSVLGEGVVVAGGAVVRGRVEAWTVVAGNPARPVRTRSPEAQRVLTRYRRWFQ